MYYNIFFLLLFLAAPAFGQVQDEDLIYYYPHQQNGVRDIAFFDNDTKFMVSGDLSTIIFDTETGNEIKRIDRSGVSYMINNETQILKVIDYKHFYIYDYETLEIVDSLETDGRLIDYYEGTVPVLTKDERYFVASMMDGFRVWDMETKKIVKTSKYTFEYEQDVLEWSLVRFSLDCNNNIYMWVSKRMLNLDPPYDRIYKYFTYKIDPLTLDTLGQLPFRGIMNFSNDCSLVLYSKSSYDPDNMRIDYFPSLENKVYREGSNRNINDVEFFNDNQNVLVGGSHFLNIIDTENGGSLVYYYGTGTIFHVAISNNEKYVLCSGATSVVLLHCRLNPNAIEEKPGEETREIYPNPATDEATVEFEIVRPEEIRIELSDINGKYITTVHTEFLSSDIHSINFAVHELQSGTYFVNVIGKELILSTRLVIRR